MLAYLTENMDVWSEGFINTLSLTVLSFVIGFVIAIPIGLARSRTGTWMSKITYGYVYIIRGTPLLVQIFLPNLTKKPLVYPEKGFTEALEGTTLGWSPPFLITE